jgi:hypothetical protein
MSAKPHGVVPEERIAEYEGKLEHGMHGEDKKIYLNKNIVCKVDFRAVHPSQRYLASALNVNIRTVNTAIGKMVALKLITCEQDYKEIGYGSYLNKSCWYQINTTALRVMEYDFNTEIARQKVEKATRIALRSAASYSADGRINPQQQAKVKALECEYTSLIDPDTDPKVRSDTVSESTASNELAVEIAMAKAIATFRAQIKEYHEIWENYGRPGKDTISVGST